MRINAKTIVTGLAAASLALGPSASSRERLTGEQELAKMLDGRVAGAPKNCLSSFQNQRMKIIDGTAIVFRDGRTVWVNVPRNAEDLDEDDILVTRQFGSQLCRLDQVTTHDRSGLFFNGVVLLGDFVPYRRAES